MNPFQPTPPEVPAAPIDIPVPNLPGADFKMIGASIAAGIKGAGGTGNTPEDWLDWIATIVGKAVASILALLEKIVAGVLGLIFKLFAGSESGTNALTAAVVSGMFGIQVSGDDVGSSSGALVDKIVGSMGANIGAGGGAIGGGAGAAGGIAPSSAAVSNFLRTVMNMEVEGWALGWVAELGSLGTLKTLGELKDGVERVMGLGRIAHQALSPAVKILAHDPYLYLLNSTLQPALLGPNELVRAYLAQSITADTFNKLMSYHGFGGDQVQALVNLAKPHLGPSQLQTLVEVGTLTNGDAIKALNDQGYDDHTASLALYAIQAAASDALIRKDLDVLVRGYAERKIDEATFASRIGSLGLPDFVVSIYRGIAADERSLNTRRPSLSEGATLVKKGIWDVSEYADLAEYYGYSPSDAVDLQLLVLEELAEESAAQQAKAAKASAAAAAALAKNNATSAAGATAAAIAETKGISVSQYEALVLEGLKTLSDFQEYLTTKGLAPDNVSALVAALQLKIQKQAAAGAVSPTGPAAPAARSLSLSDLDAAVTNGTLTVADFELRVQTLGYSTADAALLAQNLQTKLTAAKAKADGLAAAQAAIASKHVNLEQLARAVRLGLATIADYTAALHSAGYADPDATLLVGELQAQVAADTAAAAARSTAAAQPGTRGLTLAQTERAVRAGTSTMADYTAALKAAGYSDAAIAQLEGLLNLQLQTDAQVAAARGTAAGAASGRGLSIPQIEKAVKYGALPISAYTDALQASGLSPQDAQLLTLTLAAQLGGTMQTQQALPSIASLLSSHGLSLSQLESAVLKGALTLQQFGAQLTAAGVSPGDVQTLSTLVSEEQSNQAAAAQLHAAAAATATARGLNLGQYEKAVLEQVKTLDDYSAFVTSLGYSQDDVDTLTNVLYFSKAYQKLISAASDVPS